MRIATFYLMKDDDRVRATVPDHVAHWHHVAPRAYAEGPFSDGSGGPITFESDSLESAEHVVARDPFVLMELQRSLS